MNALLSKLAVSSLLSWVSPVVLIAIAIFACVVYYRSSLEQRRVRIFLILAGIVVAFRLAFAGTKTGLQYFAWLQSEVTKFMLPPYQSIGVLLQYSWTHFWLNALISIGAALLFFVVLRSLYSYNTRFFDTGEIELGLLVALVVGWPHFIVFVPAVFLSVIIVSIVRGIAFREPYTTLGLPFFLGAVVAFGITSHVITAFDLTAWFI